MSLVASDEMSVDMVGTEDIAGITAVPLLTTLLPPTVTSVTGTEGYAGMVTTPLVGVYAVVPTVTPVTVPVFVVYPFPSTNVLTALGEAVLESDVASADISVEIVGTVGIAGITAVPLLTTDEPPTVTSVTGTEGIAEAKA